MDYSFYFWYVISINLYRNKKSKVIKLHLQEPNPEDPLNKEAAEVLQNNKRLFEHNVTKAMRGGYIGETYFERCLK